MANTTGLIFDLKRIGMDVMEGSFIVEKEGSLLEFDKCSDLPNDFDKLIKFEPTIPEGEQYDHLRKYVLDLQLALNSPLT